MLQFCPISALNDRFNDISYTKMNGLSLISSDWASLFNGSDDYLYQYIPSIDNHNIYNPYLLEQSKFQRFIEPIIIFFTI